MFYVITKKLKKKKDNKIIFSKKKLVQEKVIADFCSHILIYMSLSFIFILKNALISQILKWYFFFILQTNRTCPICRADTTAEVTQSD